MRFKGVTFRPATQEDYNFAYDLKKSTEYDAVKAIFGWEEEVQKKIHQKEWQQAKPTIICLRGQPIGTYLLEERTEEFYLGRFFILPEYQGQGIGSHLLTKFKQESRLKNKPLTLMYLRSNRVEELYVRKGFKRYKQDERFVYMRYE